MAKKPAGSVVVPEEKIDPETGEILTVANGAGTNLPSMDFSDDHLALLDKYAGAGYSDKAEDGLVPIMAILQDNSAEVKTRHEKFVEGAAAGQMIIRSLRQLLDGEAGVMVQPFAFNHVYVEWEGDVGEGRPVGRFPFDDPPADLYTTPDPQDPKKTLVRRRSTGNRLVDTREHVVNLVNGIDHPMSIVVPMSGSNHGTSRLWTNMMRNMVWEGRKLPSFFRLYRLKTYFRKRGTNQTWYSYQIEPGPFINDRDLLRLGAECYERSLEKPIEGNLSDLGDAPDMEIGGANVGSGNIGRGPTVEQSSQHI